MTLPVDIDADDYRFHKTLHNDILLTVDDNGSKYDMEFKEGDVVNVTGYDSLVNAVTIAIMTRYEELEENPVYTTFGCKIHKELKRNRSTLLTRIMEGEVLEVLQNMRRIKKVNYLIIEPTDKGYNINFSVTSISDEDVTGSVIL